MRSCRKFQHFDPLTGEVPYWPYNELGNIVWRARRILSSRTSEQIHQLANWTNDLIAEYFAVAKQQEVEALEAEGRFEFLDVDEDGLVLGINLDRIDELDFPRPENTSELDALEAGTAAGSHLFEEDVSHPDLCECLAALALCQVGDAIHRLQYEYDFKALQYVKRAAKNLGAYDYIGAGQCAVAAMEAVSRAELLIEARRLQAQFQERLNAEKQQASAEVQRANDRKWEALRAQEAQQKSAHARQMAALSLRSRNASRTGILAQWDQDPALQNLSHAKAGLRLSQWLAGQDLEFFEPRTVSAWISEHKKATAKRL